MCVGDVMADRQEGDEPLLKVRGLSKHFGAVQALTDVDLDLYAGHVTAVCGDNGAGKSVLTKAIAGIHQPDHGQIFWEGHAVRIHSPRDSARLGIETVYQDLALADNLDIVQNMFLGRERLRNRLLDEDAMERAGAAEVVTFGTGSSPTPTGTVQSGFRQQPWT
jgi:ABC-type sugar transport system ATPase subunit